MEGSYSKEVFLIHRQIIRTNRNGYLIPCYQVRRAKDDSIKPEIFYPTDLTAARYYKKKAKEVDQVEQEQDQDKEEEEEEEEEEIQD